MPDKVTLSLGPETFARASAEAAREGMSLADWIARAAKREVVRAAARRENDWLAANPEVCDELDEFDRLADEFDAGWSDLPGAA